MFLLLYCFLYMCGPGRAYSLRQPLAEVSWRREDTYKWKVSLYFGDQLLLLDLVACFLFLSLRCGPMRLTSTKGRNIPVAFGHLRSLAATTTITITDVGKVWIIRRQRLHLKGLTQGNINEPLTVTLWSPVPGWVNRSTCIETSPTPPSSTLGASGDT